MQIVAGIASSGSPIRLILDQLSVEPRLAYSFRKLRADYTGPLIRLRRTTNNEEADFGPGADGFVSEADVLAWAGAGNTARCVTIYDQSGNGFHATQATAGNQPEVVSAGVYRGAVYSVAAGQVMNIPAGATNGLSAASVSAVAARLSGHPGYFKIGLAANGNDSHHPWSDSRVYTDFSSSARVSVGGASIPGIGVRGLIAETNSGTTLTIYQRNILLGSVGITLSSPVNSYFPSSTNNGLGCAHELVLFGAVLTAVDRNMLANNQISAWSIP